MSTSAPATRWVAATAGVCVAGLVGSWLLVLGPQLDAAAATRLQATEVRTQNLALAGRLAELRADHTRIDDYRADLAALRRQLPDDAHLSHLSREIHGAARTAGVTLVRLESGDAVDLATAAAAMPVATPPAAPAPTDAAPTDGAAPAETPAPADSAAEAPATVVPATPAAPPVPGMLAIPVTTTVSGSVDGVRTFLAALQTALTRQVLVTTLTVTALEESTGEDGTLAAAAGDIEAVVGALAYVLPSAAGGEAPQEGPLPTTWGSSAFLSSAPRTEEAPPPDPAAEAADAIAAAVEQRLAAATAAAEAAAAASAAASAAAAESAQAAAAQAPAPPAAPEPALVPEPDPAVVAGG